MDGMSPFSSDQWIQQYPNTAMAQSGVEPSNHATSNPIPIHKDSTHIQAGPKPTRRRLRSSQRTPVTVLNASPTDFRALVQRFTGCDSKENNVGSGSGSGSAVSFPKGPVNIDFARNDVIESSSRYVYNGSDHLQAGYGMQINGSDHVHDQSMDLSSLMATRRDGGNHG